MRDEAFMQRAIELARLGQYTTRPNPNVGCVIVKDQQIVGEGFHARAGAPHAEVMALRQAGHQAPGSTAYVTLEPCAHFGKTPPCANALIAAGISQVIMASLDPNPLVAGKGKLLLEAAGIATRVGLLSEQARALNKGFLQVMAGGRPYVRLKMAASLDGRTAMASGESKWITGEAARLDVQHWRAISGAVITGINTVLADDPALNVRQLAPDVVLADVVQPLRVVLDRQGRFPAHAQLARAPDQLLLVGTPPQRVPGAEHWAGMDLAALLNQLARQKQVYDVLVEAGPTLAGEFLKQQLVDELIIYLAPALLGGDARPMFNLMISQMRQQYRLQWVDITPVGTDLRLILQPAVTGG